MYKNLPPGKVFVFVVTQSNTEHILYKMEHIIKVVRGLQKGGNTQQTGIYRKIRINIQKAPKTGHTIHGQKRRFVRERNTPVLTKWKNGLEICAFLQKTQKEIPEKVDLLSKYSKSD